MAQANIFELARQGDVHAISSMMNSQLQLKKVTARVMLKNGCLKVMLDSNQFPDQHTLVKYVRQEITSLKSPSIKRIKVYGLQKGKNFPRWSEEVNLELQQNLTSSIKKARLDLTSEIKNISNKFENIQNFSDFVKDWTKKYYLIIFMVFLGLFILGSNRVMQKQECIVKSNLASKTTEHCP